MLEFLVPSGERAGERSPVMAGGQWIRNGQRERVSRWNFTQGHTRGPSIAGPGMGDCAAMADVPWHVCFSAVLNTLAIAWIENVLRFQRTSPRSFCENNWYLRPLTMTLQTGVMTEHQTDRARTNKVRNGIKLSRSRLRSRETRVWVFLK